MGRGCPAEPGGPFLLLSGHGGQRFPVLLRLQVQQVAGCSEGLCGRIENQGFVVFEFTYPALQVGHRVLEHLLLDAGKGAEETGPHLGDELLPAVVVVPEAAGSLLLRKAVEPLGVASGVDQLMEQRGVVRLGGKEASELRQLHPVIARRIVGLGTAMQYPGRGRG